MKLKTVCFALAIMFCVSMASAQITGKGTKNTIPVWTGPITLGDSAIFQTGSGSIGIGTKQPYGEFNVVTKSLKTPAISGNANAATGTADGVYGNTNSPDGNGVFGSNNATSGYAAGVTGLTFSSGGPGVNGFSAAVSGGIGVLGSTGPSGTAIQGVNQTCSGSVCTPVAGIAGQFATGVGGTILVGFSGSTYTREFSVDSSGNGYFGGNLNVIGNVTKGSGSFKIDHPLDPANKYLSHSFVESPDMMNIYNGLVVLDAKGEALVSLPEYFQALNSDFRYQLTAIGAPGPNLYIAEEISANHFKIAGGKPGAKVSWQVTGVRQDAYAKAHRIKVEEDKPAQEMGRFLHPELFGATEKEAIGPTSPPAITPPATTSPTTTAETNGGELR